VRSLICFCGSRWGKSLSRERNHLLILKRKIGERIFVSGPCIIQVVRFGPRSHSVRIGITASEEVKIIREELDVDGTFNSVGNLLDPVPAADLGFGGAGEAACGFGEDEG